MDLPLDRMPWFTSAHEEGETRDLFDELYQNWRRVSSKLQHWHEYGKGFLHCYGVIPQGNTLGIEADMWPRKLAPELGSYSPRSETTCAVINSLSAGSRRVFADCLSVEAVMNMQIAWGIVSDRIELRPHHANAEVINAFGQILKIHDIDDRPQSRAICSRDSITEGFHYHEKMNERISLWEESLRSIYTSIVTGSMKVDS